MKILIYKLGEYSIRALYKQGVIQQIMTEDAPSNENIQLTQKKN